MKSISIAVEAARSRWKREAPARGAVPKTKNNYERAIGARLSS